MEIDNASVEIKIASQNVNIKSGLEALLLPKE